MSSALGMGIFVLYALLLCVSLAPHVWIKLPWTVQNQIVAHSVLYVVLLSVSFLVWRRLSSPPQPPPVKPPVVPPPPSKPLPVPMPVPMPIPVPVPVSVPPPRDDNPYSYPTAPAASL